VDFDDDSIDIRPWPVSELAGQLVSCAALARRGAMETNDGSDTYEQETDRFELEAWSRSELVTWLNLAEFEVLDAPVGTLADEQVERCHDALFEASTLAWIVGVVQVDGLPIFTDGEPERQVAAWAPGPWTGVPSASRSLRVRPDEQLAAERERWELLYWRLNLQQPLDGDSRTALQDVIEEVGGIGLLGVTSGDFATDDGRAFSEFSTDDFDTFAHEAEVRLRTLNWACGMGVRLDAAPLMLDD